ncbi:DoxX family protein [Pelomonas sp. V22]|uniref:DoxX family protein n=1 Tax=Pelomonas sp. V22 TaxID=2822139 RepID=UPI0024A85B56|nr:DoxX family protein [Pelomonas sp. V22]MDI4632258.1 DoxX family protein [Pelomonas sp. V22]
MNNSSLQNLALLMGRLMMAYLFLPAGIAKLMGFAGTVGYITSVGLPMPQVAAAAALVAEIAGGIALILGLCTRWAALALALFTLVASFLFHAYWAAPADAQMMVQLLFNKNIAVAGGLFILAACGAGAWSFDAKRGRG